MTTVREARGRRAWFAGRRAERAAALLLMAKAFRILSERHAGPAGEIDLIARRGRLLAFVEVKTRATHALAAESISGYQRRRIVAAAEQFLQTQPDLAGCDMRFDAVVFGRGAWPRHIADAWRPDS